MASMSISPVAGSHPINVKIDSLCAARLAPAVRPGYNRLADHGGLRATRAGNKCALRRRAGRGGLIVSKTYVETSTELLEGIDDMVREGYYANRTEGINEAIRLLLKQYKLSKLHAKDSSILVEAKEKA